MANLGKSNRKCRLEGQGRLRAAREEYARAAQMAPDLAVARQGIARIDAALRLAAAPGTSERTGRAR